MSRLKQYLAMATVLVLPVVAACGEDVMPPPPTGSIVGQVSIEGMGIDGVTVSLSNGASTATAGGGNYRFDTVEQGSYTVTISGFPADASFDATSAPANIGDAGGTETVDFRGSYIRTASIMGTVTVENMGLAGVTVRLSGMADSETATDDSGQYSFTGLRSGTYSVEISGFDTNEVSFSSTSGAATVGVGESKVVSFDGTYLRTAGIQGQVSVDGEGLGGVTVTLMGEGAEEASVTDAGGLYAFSQLKSGAYTVAISGYDTDDYEFETTSKSVTVATGETANVPFEGTLLRTAGIAGRVSVEGMGLDGVTVTLAGAAEATATTANGGQYAFAGLAAGTYVLSIANPDEVAYNFAEDEMQKTVMLADDQSAIVNFEGTHTRTASVSGMLYLDEAPQDKMYTANEPALAHAGIPLLLQGPGINDVTVGVTGADGSFAFDNLMAGDYRVLVNMTEEIAAGIAKAGYAFVGDLTGATVNVAAGMAEQVNFPFRITMQTLVAGAVMGTAEETGAAVAGVELALYANADMTGMLGEATTDDMGMAKFDFARAANTGPAGNDNIVFVKVMEAGHDALKVFENDFTEVTYASTDRVSNAPTAVKLINVKVAFDFWVKSNETARDGDMGLGGWNTTVMMGETALEMAPGATDEDGKSTFSYEVDDQAMLPAMFTVMAAEDGQPDMGEAWELGDALTYTHTGLELPPGEDDDMLDLGPLRVTFTTQAIYVGVHRELDDRTGYTDFIGIGDGDSRPTGTAVDEIEITLMTADSRGRLRVLEYDHDADPETPDERAVATAGSSGIVSFGNIPAAMEITVVADEGSGMVIVPDSRASREIDAFGDQLDDYPDGKIVGAFGDMSGARPDVWLCPLQRQEAKCSTYAYKWATGTISGSIDGLRAGDKATVTLTPVNSNEDYADDLADDARVTAGTGGAAEYSFTGVVADGRYMVTLEANADSWGEDETGVLSVMHDEDNDEDDYSGDSATGNLSATDLRGVIRGRIANDSNGRDGLTSDESRAGVVVNLHTASAAITSGANKGRRTAGADVVATAETDGDGVFMFENLVVGKHYFVKPQGTDLYTAVRNGSTSIADEKSSDIVTHALTTAGLPPAPGNEPAIPKWNYYTSTATSIDAAAFEPTSVGAADFVLLYKDGEVEGMVWDPSVRGAHKRTVIELHQCKMATEPETDREGGGGGEAQCTEYTDVVVEATVDAQGNWGAEDLREGVYEVIPDLPAGYISVNKQGGTDVGDERTLYTQQFVELKGGRADDDTKTFYIKDRNAGDEATLEGVEVDGVACTTSASPTNAMPQCGHSDDGSFSVVVTASPGAMVRLSSSASDAAPSPGYSQAVTNGRATTVTLPKAGTRMYYVHVAAEDGYATNTAADAGFSIRRDADVRVKTVQLSWDGDRIDLNRDELGLDPDGETDPVTGTTALRVTVDEGDNGAGVPATALTVEATSMTSGFGVVTWAAFNTVDGGCLSDFSDAGNEVTVGGTSGEIGRVCFRITDSDGAATDPDKNSDNTRDYLLILTRK